MSHLLSNENNNKKYFEVEKYSLEKLKHLFVAKSNANARIVESKNHIAYFEGYFNEIGAKTIIIENDYIDRDFLEDFAGYYVRCFYPYKSRCVRLHFFSTDFDYQAFHNLLNGNSDTVNPKTLQEFYLGFLVIKPLPKRIIGRTCLKTYPRGSGRAFPIIRKYNINLFGIELYVDSLAYQEQDKAAAACATSAIWSVFQGTGMVFHHPIPSPVEITKAANIHISLESRILPSSGLTPHQIANAIRSVNLDPYQIEIKNDEYILKNTIYAYLQSQIPLIMGFSLFDISSGKTKLIGQHAVAVSGYNLKRDNDVSLNSNKFLLTSSYINKIYVHDDQIGPFARMLFDNQTIKIIQNNNEEIELKSLQTSWYDSKGRAAPYVLIIPLYHKIRIPFDLIHKTVCHFSTFLTSLFDLVKLPLRLEWSIYLTTVNELKKEIFSSNTINGNYSKKILLENMPRFIWRATAFDYKNNRELMLDLLFDATDIEQGDFFIRAIEHSEIISELLRKALEDPYVEEICGAEPEWKVFEWFKKNARDS